ncbi:hypothetical protein ACFX2A_013214 [Malus domestica]
MGYSKCEGAMGFRNLKEFNVALLAKQCWRLIHDPNSLWAQDMKWPVMSGNQIKFWVDKWVPSIDCGYPKPPNGVEVDREMHVASVIHLVGGRWDLESMHNLISEEDCMEVSNIQVGDSKREDRLIWLADRNGAYTVKLGYRWLRKNHERR